MLSLTNEQRACFGLDPVDPSWRLLSLPRSRYDDYNTYAYVDDATHTMRKVITDSEDMASPRVKYQFQERDACEPLSEDGAWLLPKTAKGKPVKLTAATLAKRPGIGMYLSCCDGSIVVGNYATQQSYYHNGYERNTEIDIPQEAFRRWVEAWCADTTEDDLAEVRAFAARKRVNVKCGEGDFFRFKLNRRLYGYGRIVLDIRAMRKSGVEFWDCYMGKPLIVGVYHVVTEDPNLSPEELRGLPMLPTNAIMDNVLFYGEYPIIGHEPLDETRVDYPVNYASSCGIRDPRIFYQCGRLYCEKVQDQQDIPSATYAGYANAAVGWELQHVSLPVLEACIRAGSNQPYWELNSPYWMEQDLRNPKNRSIHDQIRKLYGLPKIPK